MKTPLWNPTPAQIQDTFLYNFIEHCGFSTYEELYKWSISDLGAFWSAVWDFTGVIGHKGNIAVENPDDILNAVFFPQGELNYAENLLQRQDGEIVIHFYGENQKNSITTYRGLYNQVSQLMQQLQVWGIEPGDRVAGYLPNLPQTAIAMLATTALGGVWSSCSPDFGATSVIDRFSQIEPKVLFVVDGYIYNGKIYNVLERLPEILREIPSIKYVVVIPYVELNIDHPFTCWLNILKHFPPKEIAFQKFPFNHPLFILFSSGTTGKPKCIVHSTGGTLLQHIKEHKFHCNIKPNDRVFYFTTCGWMMWNWLMSALASKASLILFDGSPTYPNLGILFDIAESTQMTFMGTSAKYLSTLQKSDWKAHYSLANLRTIASTGSPLLADTFEYVYKYIKLDVNLASISGGTDIISCFMLGNPTRPVYAGQLQGAGLGLAVDVFNDKGKSVASGVQGELVCTKPFPARPIGFWNDPEKIRYKAAYYERFSNVWHHGDITEHTPEDGFIIYGRSDAVLNPGGVRIGTAEIYHHVEKVPQIVESVAIGQHWDGDIRIILFVVLHSGLTLTSGLIDIIKNQIRAGATPRHVPAKIIQVVDIPRTRNGKLSEVTVRHAVHGEPIKNKEALANPESIALFENIPDLQH